MRILVLSDSHGYRHTLDKVVSFCHSGEALDAIIHLGDYISDAQYLSERVNQRMIFVPGNCDWGDGEKEEIVECLGGVECLLCHGHTLRVKHTLLPLACRAREAGVRAALFGHTHIQRMEYEEGVLLLNPGALADEKCAVMEIEKGEIRAKLTSLNELC